MGNISSKIGRTFGEYVLLPGFTPKGCNIQTVELDTKIAENLSLGIPFISAAMTSVTGYEMALALGREKGMAVLPMRLSIENQANIVRRLKNPESDFLEEPLKARESDPLETVVKKIESRGHTKIPITNKHNVLQGIFLYDTYIEGNFSPDQLVSEIMIPFNKDSSEIPYVVQPNISVNEAKNFLEEHETSYMVVLTEDNRLEKMAFKKDFEEVKVGAAISTHKGWQERVEALQHEGVDMIFIDTSDGYTHFQDKVIEDYKEMNTGIPISGGNVVTYKGAKHLMEMGADSVKIGMSSGSICTTAGEKGVGRAPMTALIECARARDDYFEESGGRYVPVTIDGGVSKASDIVIALTFADSFMGGGYFNRFWEAAGDKLDAEGKITRVEEKVSHVVTYGEGSQMARSLDRYGHASQKTFFPEGESGLKEYAGRLKPNIKKDILKIKASMVNAGCNDLVDYRKNATIELMSPAARGIVSTTHDMKMDRS